MKRCIFFFLFVLALNAAWAQEKGPTVISADGGIARVGNMTLEWTLGESFIGIAGTTNRVYTLGFHQPIISSKLALERQTNEGMSVYPNPVQNILQVWVIPEEQERKIELVDMNGNIIAAHLMAPKSLNTVFSVKRLAQGIYHVRLIDKTGNLIQSFAVMKAE